MAASSLRRDPRPKRGGYLALPALLAGLLVHGPAYGQTAHCGTAAFLGSAGRAKAAMRPAAKRSAQAQPLYRTLETARFSLHYALLGVHQARLGAEDAALRLAIDSVEASLPAGLAGRARESAVYAGLEAVSAPPPAYIAVAAEYLESAYREYVVNLGMKAPGANVPSVYFGAPARGGRYPIDFADIVTAMREVAPNERVNPETYALTFRPSEGGMLIENDFLYSLGLDASGRSRGMDTIRSCSPQSCSEGGNLIHNYAIDWQAGLKVTCFHEFYHSVQFAYTPDPDFHVWYETGAVGMEERFAPEVDDYLQYMSGFLGNLSSVSMFDYPAFSWNSQYGNGVFHLFLARELGNDFDVAVWRRLEANGNNLRDALSRVIASRGETVASVYSRFAAQLAFSGTEARPPFPLFSPDIPFWPALPRRNVDLRSQAVYQTGPQPPMSILALRISGADGLDRKLLVDDTGMTPVIAALGSDTSRVEFPREDVIDLGLPDQPGRENLVMLANASLEEPAQAEIRELISVVSERLFAYPNPCIRSVSGRRILFSRPARSAAIGIFGESGGLVRSLEFSADSTLWKWNLRDTRNRPVPPGLYYYRETGGTLTPLLIR